MLNCPLATMNDALRWPDFPRRSRSPQILLGARGLPLQLWLRRAIRATMGDRCVAFAQQSVNRFKPPLARSRSLESLSLPAMLILSGTPAFLRSATAPVCFPKRTTAMPRDDFSEALRASLAGQCSARSIMQRLHEWPGRGVVEWPT